MRLLRVMKKRLRSLFRRDRQEDELAREFDLHIEALKRELLAEGLSEPEARREALRQFGPPEVVKEECRDMRRVNWIEHLVRDIAFSLRLFRKSPGFTLAAVGSLVLGIGANTAIFQLFEAVRLRSLPVERPEELALIRIHGERHSGNFRGRNGQFTYAVWDALRRSGNAFSGLLAYGDTPLNLAASGEMRNVEGLWVSGTFFPVLGVRAQLGRLLSPEDDRPGCGWPGVVISHGFWQREFGGDAAVLSRTLPIDGRAVPILGVAAPTFAGVEVGRRFDVAMPLCSAPESSLQDRRFWFLSVMGRLKHDVSHAAARNEVRSLSPGIFADTVPPGQAREQALYKDLRLDIEPGATGQSEFRESMQRPLTLLLCVAAFVLLLACANIANMMLARASAREHEFAVRRSLGASRWALMRQVLIESSMLAACGAALGGAAAPLIGQALLSMLNTPRDPLYLAIESDWRVLATAMTAAIVTTLLVGAAPALRAARADSRGSSASREKQLFRHVLLGAQAAFCMVLLTSAILFATSFRNLVTAPAGFDAEGVLVAHVFLDSKMYPPEGRATLIEDLHQRASAIPGVSAVARSYVIPVSGSGWDRTAFVNPADTPRETNLTSVSEGYFRVMNIPLLAGRDFNHADQPKTAPVAIVNESFARALFAGRNPIGQSFRFRESEPPTEIVGLMKDSKYRALSEPFTPIVYLAANQEQPPRTTVRFLLRSAGSPQHLIPSFKQLVQTVDPRLFMRFAVLQTQLEESILRERLMAILFGAFGVLSVMLALTGVFGVTAYVVSQRYREFGVRVALGATRGGILRLVLGEIASIVFCGIALGALIVLGAGSAASSLLYGVKAYDVSILAAVGFLLASGGLAAALAPAVRASRTDPIEALRIQ